jgi:hypothetical protein
MTARSVGTVKSGNRAPKLVAMTEVAGGKDAGDGFQVFCRDAQDDTSLWIGTTTKVRFAVVPLSIAY